jgi:proteasome lid subunit RPN8/RPN11
MTWTPPPAIIAKVLDHAERSMPRECCGLVRGEDYIEIENVSPDENAFLMRAEDFVRTMREGPVDAVAHSHVFLPPVPSPPDLTGCERSALPWLIVSVPNNTHTMIYPSGYKAPLIGRPWAWGVHDCFALIRDGMSHYAGIDVPEIEREWEFWLKDEDFIRQSMEEMGFVEMPPGTPIQHLDVFGMKFRGRVINHLGLFIGPDRILHQMHERLSVQEIYGGVYQQLTELHARHRHLMEGGDALK